MKTSINTICTQLTMQLRQQQRSGVTVVVIAHNEHGDPLAYKIATRGVELNAIDALLAVSEPIATAREIVASEDDARTKTARKR